MNDRDRVPDWIESVPDYRGPGRRISVRHRVGLWLLRDFTPSVTVTDMVLSGVKDDPAVHIEGGRVVTLRPELIHNHAVQVTCTGGRVTVGGRGAPDPWVEGS